ncbi:histidinol dehydrogenase [Candidatus Margulisiibacteriota bacterium]
MIKIIKENIPIEVKKICHRLSLQDRPEEKTVKEILKDVRGNKNAALLKYTSKFDGVDLDRLEIDFLEYEEAYADIQDDVLVALRLAIKNIAEFHIKQIPDSWEKSILKSSKLAWRYTPLHRVGIYVPGGTAAYPSSVLMNAVPAKIAGVQEIVMVTPPNKSGKINPLVLAAAKEVGINEIYKVGGAQSIAALAFGTETIRPVDKIVGPGNIYVSLAKKLVAGICGIDKLAGPSDVLIIADSSANPAYIAADMLAQAEHDVLASSILVTTSEAIAKRVRQEIEKQLPALERKDIIKKSLSDYGLIILANDINKMIEVANMIAPEHLEIMTKNAELVADNIRNAGAIFIGDYSPVALGDYIAGPNHVLPTGGTARFDSPLSVLDFLKATSIVNFSESTLQAYSSDIEKLATLEGLQAHAVSAGIRLKK